MTAVKSFAVYLGSNSAKETEEKSVGSRPAFVLRRTFYTEAEYRSGRGIFCVRGQKNPVVRAPNKGGENGKYSGKEKWR